jgi:hypothetical protein
MPRHREIETKEFTPKAWGAICKWMVAIFRICTFMFHKGELVGGEERIDTSLFNSCGDSLICNLGSPEWEKVGKNSAPRHKRTNLEQKTIDPRELGNWHL